MNLSLKQNAILYKYNKYIQVNGSLFYSFELLCQLVENELNNPNQNTIPTYWYIVIPKKYQPMYLDKLLLLFRTKYPLWNRKIYKDKQLLTEAKEKLSEDEIEALTKSIQIVNKAFERIKLITSVELLRKTFNRIVYANTNSFIDLVDYINPTTAKVIQNRQYSSISDSNFPQLKFNRFDVQFLFETPEQMPMNDIFNDYDVLEYAPKIGFKYMVPKALFNKKYRTEKIIAGHPITNRELSSFEPGYQYFKPSMFAQVTNEFYLNTKVIEYYQNFLRWDENNRIIPEARYFDIKLKVIKCHTKDISNIHRYSTDNKQPTLAEDSSVKRLINDIKDYELTSEDYLVKFLSN